MSKRKPGTQPPLAGHIPEGDPPQQGMEPPRPPTPMPPVSDPAAEEMPPDDLWPEANKNPVPVTPGYSPPDVFAALRDRQHYYEQASKHERRTYYDQTAKELIEAVLILKEAVQARQLEARSLPTSVLANLEQRLNEAMERGQLEREVMRDRIEMLETRVTRLVDIISNRLAEPS